MIGAQAIKLARNFARIIDALAIGHGDERQELLLLALGKICQYLSDIGVEINRVHVTDGYTDVVKSLCQTYFNLFSLFFTQSCQSTVWTMGYVVPYHANLLYMKYKIGYGIISMQEKEAKHSEIK